VNWKRGCEAIDEMNILPNFQGKAIHDGWKSYQDYDCEHFLCNAHHLRELTFIWEQYQQDWAIQMLILLGSIKQVVDAAQLQEIGLTRDELHSFETRYQTLLTQGLAANPPPPEQHHRRRGRQKQSPARNLLVRLQQHQTSVLGFMYDFTVPFDNNQAERDVRMVKLKKDLWDFPFRIRCANVLPPSWLYFYLAKTRLECLGCFCLSLPWSSPVSHLPA
jgi:transposase